jgi:hypothetical protein
VASKVFNSESLNQLEHYLERHYDCLERIIESLQDKEVSESYTRKKGMVQLDPTGAGVAFLPVPLGYDWTLERVTCAAAAAGQVYFYENVASPSEILEVIGLNAQFFYSDAFDNNIYIPSGSQLLIAFVGGGVNAVGTYNLQIKMVKREAQTRRYNAVDYGDG